MRTNPVYGDWEDAFASCAPYGEGRGPYSQEDTAALCGLHSAEQALVLALNGVRTVDWDTYQKHLRTYLHRCCRYYFYRGMLHGTQEALSIWTEEYAP